MQKLFNTRSQAIQLSSDDEDEFNGSSVGVGGCMPCLPRFLLGTGPIQLSIEQDATLNDYLDPRTTTSIEPLLDEYSSHNNDPLDGGNDAFGGAILHERSLTRNPFASSSAFGNISSVRDPAPPAQVDFLLETDAEDDAEFLSDHRISAVIGDTSKLSRQFELFQVEQQLEDGYKDDSVDQVEPFALDKDDWTEANESTLVNEDQQSVIDGPCSIDEEDAAATPDTSNEGGGFDNTSPITTDDYPINSSSLDNSTPFTDPADANEIDMDPFASIAVDQSLPSNDDANETPICKEDLADTPPTAALFSLSSPPSPIPTVSTTRSIRSTSLPHDAPERSTPQPLTTVSAAANDLPSSRGLLGNNGGIMDEASMMIPTTSSSPEMVPDADNDYTGKRRPSVASVAHSFLGDKLDDFTEKLAYIRKNIIMSLDDSNDDDDHEDLLNLRQQQHQPPLRRSRSGSLQDWRQQSFDPFVSRLSGKSRQQEPPAHRRSNSMMDMQHPDQHPPTHRSFSSPLLPPPASRSTNALTGVDEEDDDEDLFDFSKVVAMGKNVRNISEDLMGNGIRLFNDFSTRMKNRQHPHDSAPGDDDSFMNPTVLH